MSLGYGRWCGVRVKILKDDSGQPWSLRGMLKVRMIDRSPISEHDGTPIMETWVYAGNVRERGPHLPPLQQKPRVRIKGMRVRIIGEDE